LPGDLGRSAPSRTIARLALSRSQFPRPRSISKRQRALASAHACADAGHHEAAVSRAHFAAHHAASALLSTLGLAARTSAELREGIGRHFIRSGRLPPRFARLLVRIAADRDDADCNAASTFNAGDAHEAIEAAAEVLAESERVMREGA
jgi:uncharacterized protein (UPF0332 family)